MACCCVEITGKDGKKHTLTTDAVSAFAAVEQAVKAWSNLWWWDPDVVAIVKRNEGIHHMNTGYEQGRGIAFKEGR